MLLVTFFNLAIRLRPFILYRNFGSDFVVKHKEKSRHTTAVIIHKKYKKIFHCLVYPFNFRILLYLQDLWHFDVVRKRYSFAYSLHSLNLGKTKRINKWTHNFHFIPKRLYLSMLTLKRLNLPCWLENKVTHF